MKKHTIRKEFMAHGRIYRPDEVHDFEEWPDEVRDREAEALMLAGYIINPAAEEPIPAAADDARPASSPTVGGDADLDEEA